jgi:hypothetical protein
LTQSCNKLQCAPSGFGAELAARKTLRHRSDGERVSGTFTRQAARAASIAAVFAVANALGGCGLSSLTSGIGGGILGGGSASKTQGQPLTQEKMLTAAKSDPAMAVGGDVAGGCPRFQVWPRDHHVTIYEQGRTGDGLAVMHRGEITQTARECQVEGNRVTVKYGFSGRVLLGPKGRAGNIALPVNVFVTDAKRERVTQEKAAIEVAVTAEKPIGFFSSVRTVTFMIPEGTRPGEFEVFVGFDPKTPGAG